MHHTLFRPRALLLGGLLLALLAGGRPGPLQAQLPLLDTAAITVPTGTTQRLQMSTKKEIKNVTNSRENVLGVKKVPGDPTRIDLLGQDAGISHLELTDVDGKVEKFDIIVQADVEFLRIQLKRLIPSGNITPVPISNNVIILRGTVNHIEDVARATGTAATAMPGVQILSDLRVAGDQQVQLCVTVAQVSRSELRSMTFDFLTDSKNFFFGSTIGGAVAQPPLVGIGSANLNVAQFGQVLSGVPGANSNLLFGVIHNRWGFLGFLQALRTEGVVKSLDEPTVTTISGRPASFLVGGEQAVPVPAGLGQVGVQFEEFGTRLNVVPIVLGNGKIHLEIEPEVSQLSAADGTSIDGAVVPGRTTTRINTTVELEDGQTFVIGGLVQKNVQASAIKMPVLGDLPFLGTAFRSMSYQEDETEMVMLVTPHLVDAEDCAQAPKMLPGEETRSPDDFELFLEGILEAPRGPRQVFEDHRYIAAYKNGPTAADFPCAATDRRRLQRRFPRGLLLVRRRPCGPGHAAGARREPAAGGPDLAGPAADEAGPDAAGRGGRGHGAADPAGRGRRGQAAAGSSSPGGAGPGRRGECAAAAGAAGPGRGDEAGRFAAGGPAAGRHRAGRRPEVKASARDRGCRSRDVGEGGRSPMTDG